MRHIYDMFHISLLNLVKLTSIPLHGFPPAPLPLYVQDDHKYYEIENILDSHRIKNRMQYLVKWKGYPDSDNSLESLAHIPARSLIKEFYRRNPTKPRSSHHQIHTVSFGSPSSQLLWKLRFSSS